MSQGVRINYEINATGEPKVRSLADAFGKLRENEAVAADQFAKTGAVGEKLADGLSSVLKAVEAIAGKQGLDLGISKEFDEARAKIADFVATIHSATNERLAIQIDDSDVKRSNEEMRVFLALKREIDQSYRRSEINAARGPERINVIRNQRISDIDKLSGVVPEQDLEDLEQRTRQVATQDILTQNLRPVERGTASVESDNAKNAEAAAYLENKEQGVLAVRLKSLEVQRQQRLAEAQTAEQVARVNQEINQGIQAETTHAGLQTDIRLRQEQLAAAQAVANLVEKTNQSQLTGVQRIRAEQERFRNQYGKTPELTAKINQSFDQQAAQEEQASGRHGNVRRLFLGAKDLALGYTHGAVIEAVDYALSLRGGPGDKTGGGGSGGGGGGGVGPLGGLSGLSGLAKFGLAAGATAIGVGILADKLAELVVRESAAAKEMEDFSQRTGLTIQEAQQFSGAAHIAGVNASALEASMRQLAPALTDNSEEGKKARTALAQLGVATADFNGTARPMGQVLQDIATKLAALPTFAQRQTLALDILGRGGKALVPELLELSSSMERVSKTDLLSDKQTEDLAKASEAIKLVGLTWEHLKAQLASKAVGIVQVIAPDFIDPGHSEFEQLLRRRYQPRPQASAGPPRDRSDVFDNAALGYRPSIATPQETSASLIPYANRQLEDIAKQQQPFLDLQKQRADIAKQLAAGGTSDIQRHTLASGLPALDSQIKAKQGEYDDLKRKATAVQGIVTELQKNLTPHADQAQAAIEAFGKLEGSRALPVLDAALKRAESTKEGLQAAVKQAEEALSRVNIDITNAHQTVVSTGQFSSQRATQLATDQRKAQSDLLTAQNRLKAFEAAPHQEDSLDRKLFDDQQRAFELKYQGQELPRVIAGENTFEYQARHDTALTRSKQDQEIESHRRLVYQPELQLASEHDTQKSSTERFRQQHLEDQANVDSLKDRIALEERLAKLNGDPDDRVASLRLVNQAYRDQLVILQAVYDLRLKEAAVEKDPSKRRDILSRAGIEYGQGFERATNENTVDTTEIDLKDQKATERAAQEVGKIRTESEDRLYEAQIEHAQRVASINRADSQSQAESVRQTLQDSLALAKLQSDQALAENAVTYKHDEKQKAIEDERVLATLTADRQRSEFEAEEKLAELKKQERDEAKQQAASLYDALRGGTKSTREFFKAQLNDIGRNIFTAGIAPILQSASNVVNPTGGGAIGTALHGGLLGSSTGASQAQSGTAGQQPTGIFSNIERYLGLLPPKQQQTTTPHANAPLAPGTPVLAAHTEPLITSLDSNRDAVHELTAAILDVTPGGGVGPNPLLGASTTSQAQQPLPGVTELGAASLVQSSKNAVDAVHTLAENPPAVPGPLDLSPIGDLFPEPVKAPISIFGEEKEEGQQQPIQTPHFSPHIHVQPSALSILSPVTGPSYSTSNAYHDGGKLQAPISVPIPKPEQVTSTISYGTPGDVGTPISANLSPHGFPILGDQELASTALTPGILSGAGAFHPDTHGIHVTSPLPGSAPAAAPSGDTDVLGFLKNAFTKTTETFNVENVLHAVDSAADSLKAGDVKGAIQSLDPSLSKIGDDTIQKVQKGDYSGALANVLPLAAPLAGEIPTPTDALAGLSSLKLPADHPIIQALHDETGSVGAGSGLSRSDIAKAAAKPADAARQAAADQMEIKLSRYLGIPRTEGVLGTNAPFDLQNDKIGIEVKTIFDNANDKLTMKRDALERKNAAIQAYGLEKAYTVVADTRGSKPQYSYREGLGSFRLSSLTPARTLAELKQAITPQIAGSAIPSELTATQRFIRALSDETGSVGPGSGYKPAGPAEHPFFPYVKPSELFTSDTEPAIHEGLGEEPPLPPELQSAYAPIGEEPQSALHEQYLFRQRSTPETVDTSLGKFRANLDLLNKTFTPSVASPRTSLIDDRLYDPNASRFTSFGTPRPEPPSSQAFQLYSPNEAEDLSFDQAVSRLSSHNTSLLDSSQKLDQLLGLQSKQQSAIGDTESFGTENAIFNTISGSPSFDAVRYSAALKGDLANQKQVIPFAEDAAGKDSIYQFTVPGVGAKTLRSSLDEHGLPFRTLIPQAQGTHVVIYDQGTQLRDNVNAFANQHDVDVEQHRGTGEFLGGDTREAGHEAYRQVIEQYEATQPDLRRNRTEQGISVPADRFRSGQETLAPPLPQAIVDSQASATQRFIASLSDETGSVGPGSGRQPTEQQTFYHGTSAPEFTQFQGDLAYLTKKREEAQAFADNPIIGGGRGVGQSRVLTVQGRLGKTKDINPAIEDAIINDDDLDEVIAQEAAKARKEKYSYLQFKHPSASGDEDFDASISLYPQRDLTITPQLPQERIPDEFSATQQFINRPIPAPDSGPISSLSKSPYGFDVLGSKDLASTALTPGILADTGTAAPGPSTQSSTSSSPWGLPVRPPYVSPASAPSFSAAPAFEQFAAGQLPHTPIVPSLLASLPAQFTPPTFATQHPTLARAGSTFGQIAALAAPAAIRTRDDLGDLQYNPYAIGTAAYGTVGVLLNALDRRKTASTSKSGKVFDQIEGLFGVPRKPVSKTPASSAQSSNIPGSSPTPPASPGQLIQTTIPHFDAYDQHNLNALGITDADFAKAQEYQGYAPTTNDLVEQGGHNTERPVGTSYVIPRSTGLRPVGASGPPSPGTTTIVLDTSGRMLEMYDSDVAQARKPQSESITSQFHPTTIDADSQTISSGGTTSGISALAPEGLVTNAFDQIDFGGAPYASQSTKAIQPTRVPEPSTQTQQQPFNSRGAEILSQAQRVAANPFSGGPAILHTGQSVLSNLGNIYSDYQALKKAIHPPPQVRIPRSSTAGTLPTQTGQTVSGTNDNTGTTLTRLPSGLILRQSPDQQTAASSVPDVSSNISYPPDYESLPTPPPFPQTGTSDASPWGLPTPLPFTQSGSSPGAGFTVTNPNAGAAAVHAAVVDNGLSAQRFGFNTDGGQILPQSSLINTILGIGIPLLSGIGSAGKLADALGTSGPSGTSDNESPGYATQETINYGDGNTQTVGGTGIFSDGTPGSDYDANGNFNFGAFGTGGSTNTGGSNATSSDSSSLTNLLGGLGAQGSGLAKAVGGFAAGGAKGASSGVASTLGVAAAVDPEPISKAILGISASVAGIVSALLGNPRARRQKHLTQEIETDKLAAFPYTQPGINVSESAAGGKSVDTDFQGDSRVLNSKPYVYDINEAVGFDPIHPNRVVTQAVRQVGYTPLPGVPPAPLASTDLTTPVRSTTDTTAYPGTTGSAAQMAVQTQQNSPLSINNHVTLNSTSMDHKDVMAHAPSIADAIVSQLQGTHRLVQDLRNINQVT